MVLPADSAYAAAMQRGADLTESVVSSRAPSRRFEARREAIIASATREINRRGVKGMSLGNVAARLNLVPTAVMYYFKNKEELAAAVFRKSIAQFDELIAAGDLYETGSERISALIRAYFAYRLQVKRGEANEIADTSDVRALGSAEVYEAYEAMFRHARRLTPRTPDESRADRNVRTVLLLAELTWTPAWIYNWRSQDYGRIGERMADVLVNGVAAPGAPWSAAPPPGLALEADDLESSPGHFLRAATQLINDEGYHGASVERISARLKVTKGAFYHYNATKDDLVVACFQRTFDLMWRAIDEAEAIGGSGLQVLATIAAMLVGQQLGDAPMLRTSALSTVPGPVRGQMLHRLRRITIRFASLLCDGIADGSIRPVDTSVTAQMITAAINAASETPYFLAAEGRAHAAEHYVRSLFLGLCPEG